MIDASTKKILCMFSGGIDSTGVLYLLLNDEKYAKYDIHVHFIKIINRENRHEAETRAVRSCIEWFGKHSREFLYSENVVSFSFLKQSFPWDVDIINFVSAEIIGNIRFNYDFRAVGKNKTDMSTHSITPDYERSNKILDIILEGYNKKIERIYPVIDMTKKEIWDMLPEELRTKTWSCRTPKYNNNPIYKNNWIPCGHCGTCITMKKEQIIYYDPEYWNTLTPPRSPNDYELSIYKKHIKGKVLLLGETSKLREIADEGLDLFPTDFARKGNWNNIDGFYDTIIGDGVLGFEHGLSLIDNVKNHCNRFICRSFGQELKNEYVWYYTKHFFDEFPNSSEVIKTQKGCYIVIWDFNKKD